MDELNLAARFGGGEDERMPLPMRKRKRKTIPGTGMEKPTVIDDEDMGDKMDLDLDLEEEPEEEGGAFADLVERMQGASASAGRAAEKRKKMKGKSRPGNDSLRAEFRDRPGEEA